MSSQDDLTAVYFEEADELQRDLEEALLLLESLPDDRAILDRIFRSAHTLKGNSAMFGFERVAAVTHELENLLDGIRAGGLVVNQAIIDALLLAVDGTKALLGEARGGPTWSSDNERTVIARLAALAQGASEAESPHPATAPEEEPAVDDAGSTEDMQPAEASPPPPAQAVPAAPPEKAPSPSPAAPAAIATSVATPAPAAEPLAPAPAPAPLPSTPASRPAAAENDEEEHARRPAAQEGAASIRVPIEKLDRLVNLVGEIVITQSMVSQLAAGLPGPQAAILIDTVLQMERHCRELQERVLGVRMLPLRALFGRFNRLVRDTAAALGKHVQLHVTGEETELDKTVIERIGDPITHLLRNSLDHGIEPPEGRLAAGKPEAGRVSLSAYQKGSHVFIEVQDDGRGLDRKKILDKARRQGLVPADAQPSEAEIDQLIFLPGFSTADKVTAVSGRGVGMDVVKKSVEALQGTIALATTPGAGSTFQIKLPLSLAILEGLLLRVGREVYVVSLISVVESVRPKASQVRTIAGGRGELLDVRGEHLPLVRLHQLFGLEPAEQDPTRGLVVILDDGQTKMGLLVDELLGQHQVVIKSLDENYGRVQGVAGATILGDGRVALILDGTGIAALARAATPNALGARAA